MKQIELFAEKLTRDPACKACRLSATAKTVCMLGRGPAVNDIVIIGEAPGRKEDETGKPFVGSSGKLLMEALEKYGIDDPFIMNAVSCRPPDNRTPTKGEIKACKRWVDHQLRVVQPKYVLLLGNVPLMSITGAGGISKRRGRPFELNGVIYLPTFHPAFILRDPSNESTFERDIQLFKDIIDHGGIPREKHLNSKYVNSQRMVDDMINALEGTVSFDIETNSLYPWQTHNEKGKPEPAKINTIGFGTRDGEFSLILDDWERDEIEAILHRCEEKLRDCEIVVQNGKFDFLWMWVHFGVKWHELDVFDTMIAHYLLDENDRHGLKYLAQKYCGAPDWDIDGDTKKGKGNRDKLITYHAHDLYYTRKLRTVFGKMLRKDEAINRVFKHLMMPIARLFVEVEYDGVYVDETKWEAARDYLQGEYHGALQRLQHWAPSADFNWGSSKQLGHLLFAKKKKGGFGIEPLDKTKAGKPSTSESVLKRIDHPCVGDLLKFREAKQQLSFFIEGWKPFFHHTKTGVYLHPSFKLTGTVTGRPSCEHPNLQQVPRDERIRSLITAPPGWTLVDCDLSQIELRIAAFLAREEELMAAFIEGRDPHWLTCIKEIARGGAEAELVTSTAHKWLRKKDKKAKAPRYSQSIELLLEMGADAAIDIDGRWKEFRKKAKAVNFGFLYGMWWKKFKIYARDNYGVTVTDEQAEAAREAFFETYPGFPDWHKRQKLFARRNGYVRTLTGRKRRLPDAMSKHDSPQRGAAERQAVNSPVQGFAAELNLMIALEIRKKFTRKEVRIVGTVHDSILMWAKKGREIEVVKAVAAMTKRPLLFDVFDIEIDVPIEGDAKIGAWGKGISPAKWVEQMKEAA